MILILDNIKLSFTCASLVAHLVENLPATLGDLDSIPGLGRSPGEGNSYPHQYSCLENPRGQRSPAATVHVVAESDRTERLSMAHVLTES